MMIFAKLFHLVAEIKCYFHLRMVQSKVLNEWILFLLHFKYFILYGERVCHSHEVDTVLTKFCYDENENTPSFEIFPFV